MARALLWAMTAVLAALSAGLLTAARSPSAQGIAPETVAEYIHAVIEADRAIYTKHVVDRLHTRGILEASEHWESDNTLPLPAQLLIDAARLVAKKQRGIRYRLISLWPIYERNGPATDFERSGLEAVLKQPDRPHTGFLGGDRERFFQAIYADIGGTASCIGCHNAHPHSPRRDFKINDVMGGIVITVPVGEDVRGR
jgi:uncharacterized protein DUF3365